MGSAGIVNHSVCMSEQTAFGDRLICDYIDFFVIMKERSGAIERSTVRDYHAVARLIVRYIGTCTVSDMEVMAVSDWMASMVKEACARGRFRRRCELRCPAADSVSRSCRAVGTHGSARHLHCRRIWRRIGGYARGRRALGAGRSDR